MKIKFIFLALLSGFILSACDKKDDSTAATTPAATTPAATTPAATTPAATTPAATTPAATTPAATTPAASADSTGIPECDAYFDKVMSCYETKVPEQMRGAMIDGMNQMKESWSAASGEEKAAVAESCKQALEASKASLQAYGCTM